MTRDEFIAAATMSANDSAPDLNLPLGEWIARLVEEEHCCVTADEIRKLFEIEPAWKKS